MVIFWILFVWLPLAMYALQFWKYSVRGLWVVFNVKQEFEMLAILFLPPTAVICFCLAIDATIEYYVWGNK